jgi:hypothetical protein
MIKPYTATVILCGIYLTTFWHIWNKYISETTFWQIWNKYIPEIKFLSPHSDLCFKCKEMRFNSKYWTEQESDKNKLIH